MPKRANRKGLKMVRRLIDRKGLSLVELLVALAILQVAGIITVHLVASAKAATDRVRDRSVVVDLAQMKLEELRRQGAGPEKLAAGENQGDFAGEDVSMYRWRTNVSSEGDLYEIKVTIEERPGEEGEEGKALFDLSSRVTRRQ